MATIISGPAAVAPMPGRRSTLKDSWGPRSARVATVAATHPGDEPDRDPALVAAMLFYDLRLGLVALAPVPVALALSKAVGARVTERTLRAREANAALTEVVQEGLTGLRVLRVSGRAGAYTQRLHYLADAQAAAELAASRLDTVLATTYTTLVSSGVVAVVWLGGHLVVTGQLTVGALAAFLALFGRLTARAFRIPARSGTP